MVPESHLYLYHYSLDSSFCRQFRFSVLFSSFGQSSEESLLCIEKSSLGLTWSLFCSVTLHKSQTL